MKQSKKLNEGIRIAKEGIEECWDDMGGQEMTTGEQGEQMSVTISMPGKNISVTTDSADEIGNILRLAGITLGGATAGDVDGDGDHDMTDHAAEVGAVEEPAVMYVGAGPTGGEEVQSDDAEEIEIAASGDEEESEEEESNEEESEEPKEAVGDTSYTSKGGSVTQTSTGQVHKAGSGVYGGTETDAEEAARKEKEQELAKKDLPEASDPQLDRYHELIAQGMDPDQAEEEAFQNELDDELDESKRILQLAGVTNEAQSAAQKAAFKAMIAKKNGDKPAAKSDDKADDNKKPDADGDGVPDWADKDKEVKEEAPATNSMFGQGVYEGEAASHDYIDYVNAGGQEPGPELTNQPGVEYDPDSGIISVRNATSLANTHRALTSAGWQKQASAARANPMGAGQAKQAGDTAYQLESARILALAGVAESKLMNSPAGTSMPEPKLFDNLPSAAGQGAGHKDYGQNRANNQGENPMGIRTPDISVEEAFQNAMGEYRKFVSENIAKQK